MRKLLVLAVCCLVAFAPALPLLAGTGTYTDGTPDTLELRVLFMYDETDPAGWEPVFDEASKLLYNATEKQVRIGKVIVYNNCPEVDSKADVKIYDDNLGANAHPGGLGRLGTRIRLSQTHETVTTSGPGNRGQFGLVHELGHYAFGVLDEYLDKSGNRTSTAYCIDQGGTTASVMDGGTTVNPKNQRHEFCWSGDHRTGQTAQDRRRTIGGQDYEDTDSWTWLAAYVADRYGATLTVPTTTPADDVAGHGVDPVFEYHDCGLRAVTCIDRSGSMAGLAAVRRADGAGPFEGTPLAQSSPLGSAPIDLAKQGAGNFINLLLDQDRAAVTSFASDAGVNYAMNDMSQANRAAAQAAIGTIQAGGSTNIGGGLQTSLDQIAGDGDPIANEVIVLLSDGLHNTGTPPASVLPALKQRGVTVHTIGLGQVDAALMSQIASETGGKYLFATSAAQINAHFIDLLREARSEGRIAGEEGELAAGEDSGAVVPVDGFTSAEAVRYVLVWNHPEIELDLSVARPDGSVVGPSDPGVTFVYDPDRALKSYVIATPAEGDWSLTIANPESQTTGYTLQAISKSTAAKLAGYAESELLSHPEPLHVRAAVHADSAIAGADVTAVVERPNGGPVFIRLHDDGEPSHGDEQPGDGLYSALFRGFFGDGSYTVRLRADTEGATTAVWGHEDGPDSPPQPVIPFVRETLFSTVVEGSQLSDGDLDGAIDVEEDGAPNGGDANGDGIADAQQPGVASLLRVADGGYLTLEAAGDGCEQLTGVTTGIPVPPLDAGETPYGTVAFLLECSGGTVALEVHGAPSLGGLQVFRYGPTPDDPNERWYDFAFNGRTGAEIDGDRVVLHLQDGGRGDDDLTVNGVVVVHQLALVVGGTSVLEIPTLSGIGTAALVLLLAAAAFVLLRRARAA